MVRRKSLECYLCGDKITKKPSVTCVVCGKPVCPRCCFNRIHKRKTYYICNRDRGKFDPETVEQIIASRPKSERRVTFPRRKR